MSKFLKIIECNKNKRLIGRILAYTRYGYVLHADGKNKQGILWPTLNNFITKEVSDKELMKLCSHWTTYRKYNVYSTQSSLRNELIDRGYTLDIEKNRWKKRETV